MQLFLKTLIGMTKSVDPDLTLIWICTFAYAILSAILVYKILELIKLIFISSENMFLFVPVLCSQIFTLKIKSMAKNWYLLRNDAYSDVKIHYVSTEK